MQQSQLLHFLDTILGNSLCDTSVNTKLGTTTGDADGQWLLWIYKAWINYELLSASMTTPLTIRSPPSLYSTYTALEGVSVEEPHTQSLSSEPVQSTQVRIASSNTPPFRIIVTQAMADPSQMNRKLLRQILGVLASLVCHYSSLLSLLIAQDLSLSPHLQSRFLYMLLLQAHFSLI